MEKGAVGSLASKRSIPWALFFIVLAVCPAAVAGQGLGKWTVRAPLLSPRTEVAAVQLLGKIFVIGGLGKSGDLLEEYDPAADRWRKRAPMPTRRSGIAAAALEGKIFVFGGEANWRTLNLTEIYHPGPDTWSTGARMPTARHGFGVAKLGGKIYVVSGGPKAGATYSSVNEVYTPR